MPHCWAAGDYVLLLRDMLLMERGDGTLELLPGALTRWLEGPGIKVEKAPTTFGRVSFTAQLAGREFELRFEGARRQPPVLELDLSALLGREPVRVTVQGKPVRLEAGVLHLLAGKGPVDIRASL